MIAVVASIQRGARRQPWGPAVRGRGARRFVAAVPASVRGAPPLMNVTVAAIQRGVPPPSVIVAVAVASMRHFRRR